MLVGHHHHTSRKPQDRQTDRQTVEQSAANVEGLPGKRFRSGLPNFPTKKKRNRRHFSFSFLVENLYFISKTYQLRKYSASLTYDFRASRGKRGGGRRNHFHHGKKRQQPDKKRAWFFCLEGWQWRCERVYMDGWQGKATVKANAQTLSNFWSWMCILFCEGSLSILKTFVAWN